MRFKQFLSESSDSKVSVDIPSFTLREILACHKNAGYDEDASSYLASKYLKYDQKKNAHTFAVLWFYEDGAEDEQYCINEFYVSMNKNGVVAEPGAMPVEAFATKAEGTEALRKM